MSRRLNQAVRRAITGREGGRPHAACGLDRGSPYLREQQAAVSNRCRLARLERRRLKPTAATENGLKPVGQSRMVCNDRCRPVEKSRGHVAADGLTLGKAQMQVHGLPNRARFDVLSLQRQAHALVLA